MDKIIIERTDEEREEQVKQWIRDYWLVATVTVVLAIGVVYGLKQFRLSKAHEMSGFAFQLETIGKQLDNKQLDKAVDGVMTLQKDARDTTFASIATLTLAKQYFTDKEFTKSGEQYDWLIANSSDLALRDVARLRKARVLSDEGRGEEAVEVLAGLEGKENIIEANSLKGDIYLSIGAFDKAKLAYESIQGETSINQQFIEQRLNLLAIKEQMANQ